MLKFIAEYFLADGLFGIVKLVVSFFMLCAIVYVCWWLILAGAVIWGIVWLVKKGLHPVKDKTAGEHKADLSDSGGHK